MVDPSSLVNWFRSNARPLPWRTEPREPYATLVSELMAQQTQLDRVVPKFVAFMRRFPTLSSLAAASEEDVVEMWSGLGYYRRARLLHRLAREVTASADGLPTKASDLEKLPGIGPYTAAAVASLVHGEAAPLMDGNVGRVGARVLAEPGDPRTGAAKRRILEWVEELMDSALPGEVNEALMELGATLCTPARPDCVRCPLNDGCRARIEGDPEVYPPPRQSRPPIELRWLAVIVEDRAGRWLLREVTEGPILRGLWLPPFAEIDTREPISEQVRRLLPFRSTAAIESAKPIKHSITHRRIEIRPVRVRVDPPAVVPVRWSWVDPESPKLPTSSLLGKLRGAFFFSRSAPALRGRGSTPENE
ncbi:MAG: A/G-specific adenine glycosylase [Candidatus Sulfomarinibacteraceae bacterium]